MNKLYLAKCLEPDYDQLNHIVVVSDNYDGAVKLCVLEYGYAVEESQFLTYFEVEQIGFTGKPIGTLILRDY